MKKVNLFLIIFMMLVLSGCGKNLNFTKTNTIKFHNLTLEIPAVFKTDNENNDENIIFYTYDDNDKNYCMLDISVSYYTKSDLKAIIREELLDKDFVFSEKDINGYKWSIGYIEEDVKHNQTVYAINNDNKEYLISYDDLGSGEDCSKLLKIIEKELKFN